MNAVVVLQIGNISPDKQERACYAYLRERGYQLAALIRAGGDAGDAVDMVRRGVASVVVVAFGGRRLASDVEAAGGRVEALRPTPHVVEPHRPRGLLARLVARGKSVREIAELLDEPTQDIRDRLNRGE